MPLVGAILTWLYNTYGRVTLLFLELRVNRNEPFANWVMLRLDVKRRSDMIATSNGSTPSAMVTDYIHRPGLFICLLKLSSTRFYISMGPPYAILDFRWSVISALRHYVHTKREP